MFAEAVRFELTVPCDTPVFKTGALNHYATPPCTLIYIDKSSLYYFPVDITLMKVACTCDHFFFATAKM